MKLNEALKKKIKREQLIKLLFVIAIIVGGLTIILAVPGLLVSFLLAFVITYLFKPIVTTLERRGLNRTLAVLIPFIITGFLFSAVSGIVITRITQQATSFQTELPKYVNVSSALIKKRTKSLNRVLAPFGKFDLGEKAGVYVQNSSAALLNKLPDWLSSLLSTVLLAPFFAFFMLRDGSRVIRLLLSIFPNNLFEVALNLFYQINQQLGSFIRARLLEAIIVGGVVWLGLYTLNFPYASLLGFFAGLTNLIPYVGPIIGAVPGILVALVNADTTAAVALVGMVYVIAQAVDMIFIIPLVVAKIVDLHPVTVVIVIIMGSQIMGILGMIISVPVASILKLTFTEIYNHVVDFRA